jgi:hypothetical protein
MEVNFVCDFEQLAAQIPLCTAFVNLFNGRPSFCAGLATNRFSWGSHWLEVRF